MSNDIEDSIHFLASLKQFLIVKTWIKKAIISINNRFANKWKIVFFKVRWYSLKISAKDFNYKHKFSIKLYERLKYEKYFQLLIVSFKAILF
jgi:hypothetical protein